MPSALLTIRLTPGSSRELLEVQTDGFLRAWVHATPTDGQANVALIKLIADRLDLAPSLIRIAKGHASRMKIVAVDGMSTEECKRRLSAPK